MYGLLTIRNLKMIQDFKNLNDSQYIEASRLLGFIDRLPPMPLVHRLQMSCNKYENHYNMYFPIIGIEEKWMYYRGVFVRTNPSRRIFAGTMSLFCAKVLNDSRRAMAVLAEVYSEQLDGILSSGREQILLSAATLLNNRIRLSEMVTYSGINSVLSSGKYPKHLYGHFDLYAIQQPEFLYSHYAVMTRYALLELGWKPKNVKSEEAHAERYRGYIVQYFCSAPGVIEEVCLAGESEPFFRMAAGRACEPAEIPAFSPRCYSGLLSVITKEFDRQKVLRAYRDQNRFFDALTIPGPYPIREGVGLSTENEVLPWLTAHCRYMVGRNDFFWGLARCVENPGSLLCYFDGKENVDTLKNSRKWSDVLKERVTRAYIDDIPEEKAWFTARLLTDASALNIPSDQIERVLEPLLPRLDPAVRELLMTQLVSARPVELHTRKVVDKEYTIVATKSLTSVESNKGFTLDVCNFSVDVQGALSYPDELKPSYYQVRINSEQGYVVTALHRRALTSVRELVASVKYVFEHEGIPAEPRIIDMTAIRPAVKYWDNCMSQAPVLRGTASLGFVSLPDESFQIPGIIVRNDGIAQPIHWLPKPDNPGLSYFRGLPSKMEAPAPVYYHHPNVADVVGYVLSGMLRTLLGWPIQPLSFQDDASSREIVQALMYGIGQTGFLILRQTDGMGVYRKIFANLSGYPLFCLGDPATLQKSMTGPVVVGTPTGAHTHLIDNDIHLGIYTQTMFWAVQTAARGFLLDRRRFIPYLVQEQPEGYNHAEGHLLLRALMTPTALQSTITGHTARRIFPELVNLAMDVPEEQFGKMFKRQKEKIIMVLPHVGEKRKAVVDELRRAGVEAIIHGTDAVSFPADAAYLPAAIKDAVVEKLREEVR